MSFADSKNIVEVMPSSALYKQAIYYRDDYYPKLVKLVHQLSIILGVAEDDLIVYEDGNIGISKVSPKWELAKFRYLVKNYTIRSGYPFKHAGFLTRLLAELGYPAMLKDYQENYDPNLTHKLFGDNNVLDGLFIDGTLYYSLNDLEAVPKTTLGRDAKLVSNVDFRKLYQSALMGSK